MNNLLLSENVTLDRHEIDDLWKNINSSPSDRIAYRILIASFIFAIFGSISNLMTVIVLRRLSTQLSTFVYLTGLSLSDMITCTSFVLTHTIEFIFLTRRSTSITIFFRYIDIILGGLAAGSRVLSFWISTAVTMDRWILICYPIHGKKFCTLYRAKIISRTLFIIAFLYSIPLFFEYEVILMPGVYEMILSDNESLSISDEISLKNTMLVTKGYSNLARLRLYRWSYMFFNAIFVYTLPTITIVCFNLQLIRALHRVKSRTKRLKEKHHTNGKYHSSRLQRSTQSKYSVTSIVIAMVLILFLCRSPTFVLWFLWSFELTIKKFFDSTSSSPVRRFHNIANLIAIINAATNFLPFCVFGQLFRAECLNIYCCRTLPNEQLIQQPMKKSGENNPRIIKYDNMEYRHMIRNDHLQNNLPFPTETSSTNRSTSVNSSANIIRLCDSPFHFSSHNHVPQHSKVPSTTTPLLKETIDL